MTRTTSVSILVAWVLPLTATMGHAATPEQTCQNSRYSAAAKYAACQHKAEAKLYGGGTSAKFDSANGKCSAKYQAVWAKLAAKAIDW